MEVVISSAASPTAPSSFLNPNAPLFVPMSFRTVEDFSDQWWHLVHSSPSFRHYWLRHCFQDPQPLHDSFFDDQLLFQLFSQNALEDEEDEEEYHRELVTMGALKWRRDSGWAEVPRYADKVPKVTKARMISPRTIQQPR